MHSVAAESFTPCSVAIDRFSTSRPPIAPTRYWDRPEGQAIAVHGSVRAGSGWSEAARAADVEAIEQSLSDKLWLAVSVLVNRSDHFVTGQGCDHALDLSPVAEALHVACVAAGMSARGGFEARIVAISRDQSRGIVKRRATGNEE